ncbi:hypothetical protein [Puniceicoccus vermicola]|uniref:Uncharacterized protein n=1 Tax=Puniceicoccus vermicola TaxID=388746 RepID=A0A7X1B0I9_9BACT|nr:hypothetical protein [Puniceicoccus vermicola]MBC2603234.1 hypothetical protein [Puniceicoccus vermicola]
MTSTPPSLSAISAAPRDGFALVISLTLMAFLILLVVGLFGLTSVNLQQSRAETEIRAAQANARLGTLVALSQLQQQLGPDQRITARAEALGGGSISGSRAWWVGAAPSDSPAFDINQVTWLASGLNINLDASDQIDSVFNDPVILFGGETFDLALTGGEPLEAGIVPIPGGTGASSGGYAYMVDDNGLKAQLAASSPEVRNDRPVNDLLGGSMLPGTYQLGNLTDMDALLDRGDSDLARYSKIGSSTDLLLLGLDRSVAKRKYFGYTGTSLGVLADVRKGGLKRDLTIAFEDDPNVGLDVYSELFAENADSDHLVVDSEKRSEFPNDYIHWDIFRQYYNIKKWIHIHDTAEVPVLDINTFNKRSPNFMQPWRGGSQLAGRIARGQVGPHEFPQPYDTYISAWTPIESQAPPNFSENSRGQNYVHNPIFPLLSRMQQYAWFDYNPGNPTRLKTRSQLWVGHYNPYNVGLNIQGGAVNFGFARGPRILNYPQIRFTVDGVQYTDDDNAIVDLSRVTGFSTKLESNANNHLIDPGRSQLFAFDSDKLAGTEVDNKAYSPNVRNLTTQSVFRNFDTTAPLDGSENATIEFVFETATMFHGLDESLGYPNDNPDREVAQLFFAPYTHSRITGDGGPPKREHKVPGTERPGLAYEATLENSRINNRPGLSFALRTTREPESTIRPIIDANIRAQWNNPRWDSPLGVDVLAAYSMDPEIKENKDIIQSSPAPDNQEGYLFMGGGRTQEDGFDRVILFDIPREDLVSLGQLQHASAGRFSYEPTYIVGNSYANPRIPLDEWKNSIQDTFSDNPGMPDEWAITGSFDIYDASYLVNEEIWDSYIFTTIPQANDNNTAAGGKAEPTWDYEALLDRTQFLPNPRFIPYEPVGSTFSKETLTDHDRAVYHNAGHVLVDGAFNVNSSSVDAWEAFLSGTLNLPIEKTDNFGMITGFDAVEGVRFPRVKSLYGDGMESGGLNENYWMGFRELSPAEVRQLAEAIVVEVKERGPFRSLGEFVNRKLVNGDLGKAGALQAALDATVNNVSENSSLAMFGNAVTGTHIPSGTTQGAGYPGQLLQGDILQALSPFMQVRSDTFTIRSYGEAKSPTGEVTARSWCEAIVQRFPDPVTNPAGGNSTLEELERPSSPFGRSFRLLSFRWLHPEEI